MGRCGLTEKFLVNCHRWSVTQSMLCLTYLTEMRVFSLSLSYGTWGTLLLLDFFF